MRERSEGVGCSANGAGAGKGCGDLPVLRENCFLEALNIQKKIFTLFNRHHCL